MNERSHACGLTLEAIKRSIFFPFFYLRDVPMTPYNHLCSQHHNASWRGQFMYNAQLAPHTTFNTKWVWPTGAVGPHRIETFPRSHPETTFQVYKHCLDRHPERQPLYHGSTRSF